MIGESDGTGFNVLTENFKAFRSRGVVNPQRKGILSNNVMRKPQWLSESVCDKRGISDNIQLFRIYLDAFSCADEVLSIFLFRLFFFGCEFP
jgi:hypothetical protein